MKTGLLMMMLGLLSSAAIAQPPNILLIVADDLGYTDIGVFGSDIRTPTIDKLAAEGIAFTQFHTANSCGPTRAMLMSGNNNHIAGIARQAIHRGRITDGLPGYEGHLSDRVEPLPRVLKNAGYRTYMVGKWHLGYESGVQPDQFGFSRSFNLDGGAANHFDEAGLYEPSVYYEHGKQVPFPEGGYTTEVYTDKLLQYLKDDVEDERPFFAYAAYTSPHWPLQVPDEDLHLYAGQFDEGYEAYRLERFAALKKAGVISADHPFPPTTHVSPAWETLTENARNRESRKMELYAAMVDNLDRHIARLLRFLRDTGQYENTLIVFMSDNGAAPGDFYNRGPYVDYIRKHYSNDDFSNWGRKGSFITYDAPWAEAGSASHRGYKGLTYEGGLLAPLIISGPGIKASGEFNSAYFEVTDLAPTFFEIAGATYPAEKEPLIGKSMLTVLSGEQSQLHDDHKVTAYFHGNRAYVREGDWKLVNSVVPFDEAGFSLYHLPDDAAESTDLRESQPEKFNAMVQLWRKERARLGIVLPRDL